jgi:hypothetical protein
VSKQPDSNRISQLVLATYPQLFPPSMKIKREQLDRLAKMVITAYQGKDLIIAKGQEADIKSKIMEIVSQNFAEEEAIEEEARRMLSSHAQAAKNMDPYKMFLLAKQKIAAKKGFIL